MSRPVLVSACLLGLRTRYDNTSKRNKSVIAYLKANDLIPVPVCPEQLAGLPTPRPRTYFLKSDGEGVLDGRGHVQNERNENVDEHFIRGAQEAAKAACLSGCEVAIMKEKSPSCGVNTIYKGDELVPGKGVTTALLRRNGLIVISENDLDTLKL